MNYLWKIFKEKPEIHVISYTPNFPSDGSGFVLGRDVNTGEAFYLENDKCETKIENLSNDYKEWSFDLLGKLKYGLVNRKVNGRTTDVIKC